MADEVTLELDPEIEQRIEALARFDVGVLITGPTGTGKSAVARRIHALSARRKKPLIVQNCGAIPEGLAESTLFGHEVGAFTGAHRAAPGIVAGADGGTLFLDEIGELSLAVQAKLLLLLQDGDYRPVGSAGVRTSRFRLIAATNRDLIDRCNQGLFRADLYHRINGLSLSLRPLRDAPDLAPPIAAAEAKRRGLTSDLAAEVMRAVVRLTAHPTAWPGNIRELIGFVQRCVLGVDEAERQTLSEWARWQTTDGRERLTPLAPSTSPSLADRQRYAGLIQELANRGGRPKAAFSRSGSLKLASRLLDVYPEPLSLNDLQHVLETGDPRTVKSNVDDLVKHGLVEECEGGIVASWPPATSTLLRRHEGHWCPVGRGEIVSAAHGDRVRIEVTSKRAAKLGIVLVTHRPGGASTSAVIANGKDLPASKPRTIEIALVGAGGLEQILVHIAPSGRRDGMLVEPVLEEGIMPDSAALEQGRRAVLDRWREGWLAEHLLFHVPS